MQPGEPEKKLPRESLVQRAVETDPERCIGLVLHARSKLVCTEQRVEPAPPVGARGIDMRRRELRARPRQHDVRDAGIAIEQPILLDDDYMAPVAERIAAMLRTGTSPMTREDLLAPVDLMNAIDRLLV